MKKQLILLFTLIIVNLCYSSFTVSFNYINLNDTLLEQKETSEKYHLRMQKQGFDINNCMCKDCRLFKGVNYQRNENTNSRQFFGTLGFLLLIIIGILMALLIRILIIGFGNIFSI